MQQPAQTPEDSPTVPNAAASEETQPEVAKAAKSELALLWPAIIVLAIAIVVILFFVLR